MEKINIVNLLKNCPKGMELDCTMYEDVYFDYVDELNIIHCYIKNEGFKTSITFNQHGTPNSNIKSKCVIFPKGKTTWGGFVPLCKFKDGDILVHTQNQRFVMSIYHKGITERTIKTHCILWDKNEGLSANMNICCYPGNTRLATEEEKQKLFDAIQANGYKWNTETKTLERLVVPKFKVGDKIKMKVGTSTIEFKSEILTIIEIKSDKYIVEEVSGEFSVLPFVAQDYWELVPDKFDISTFFEQLPDVKENNFPNTDWNQVRIQAAIAAMQGLCNSCHDDVIREIQKQNDLERSSVIGFLSVRIADALVEELKKGGKG